MKKFQLGEFEEIVILTIAVLYKEAYGVSALQSPADISISKKMAVDFFGSPGEAMGKTIRYENKKDLKITAVFENAPKNSSAQFDYVINWQTFLENNGWAKKNS